MIHTITYQSARRKGLCNQKQLYSRNYHRAWLGLPFELQTCLVRFRSIFDRRQHSAACLQKFPSPHTITAGQPPTLCSLYRHQLSLNLIAIVSSGMLSYSFLKACRVLPKTVTTFARQSRGSKQGLSSLTQRIHVPNICSFLVPHSPKGIVFPGDPNSLK